MCRDGVQVNPRAVLADLRDAKSPQSWRVTEGQAGWAIAHHTRAIGLAVSRRSGAGATERPEVFGCKSASSRAVAREEHGARKTIRARTGCFRNPYAHA